MNKTGQPTLKKYLNPSHLDNILKSEFGSTVLTPKKQMYKGLPKRSETECDKTLQSPKSAALSSKEKFFSNP